MNPRPTRRPRPPTIALLTLLIVVAGCSAAGSTPGASSAVSPVTSPASPTTSPVPATASLASPSAEPPASALPPSPAGSAAACTLPGPGRLASDTLTDATLERTGTGSTLTLVFGIRPPEAIAQPTIAIGFVEPPFSMAGSGQPVSVAGDRFLRIRMGGMVVGRPNGDPVYTGERDLRSAGGTIPQAVMTDESEGVITWILGLTGSGCPTLTRDPSGGERLVLELSR